MTSRFNRLTGAGVGLLVGSLWIVATAAVGTRFFTRATPPDSLPHVLLGVSAIVLLGSLGYIAGHFFEIAREQAGEAERRARELDVLLDSSTNAILVIDAGSRVVRVTRSYLDFYGLRREDALGRNALEIIEQFGVRFKHPNGAPMSPSEVAPFRALHGERVTNQLLFVEAGERRIEILLHASPIVDEATGEVTMAISSGRDVTEFRRLDRLKDEFIATASHEMRTPLTVIRALAQLSLFDARGTGQTPQPPGATSEVATNLENIIAQTDNLTVLINQMIDTSRIDAGKLTLRTRSILLPEFLKEETQRLLVMAESRPLLLDLTRLRQPRQPVAIDIEKVGQILSNLVSNAAKYSPPGAPITVGAQDVPDGVEVWVRDEGMGVPVEDREAIFAKFFRSRNAVNSDRSGLGLGLYICRGLVEMHGGRIWFDETSGPGSTFRFFLPATPTSQA